MNISSKPVKCMHLFQIAEFAVHDYRQGSETGTLRQGLQGNWLKQTHTCSKLFSSACLLSATWITKARNSNRAPSSHETRFTLRSHENGHTLCSHGSRQTFCSHGNKQTFSVHGSGVNALQPQKCIDVWWNALWTRMGLTFLWTWKGWSFVDVDGVNVLWTWKGWYFVDVEELASCGRERG